MNPLISIKDLSVQFKQDGHIHQAVKQVSFNLKPGELFALVGESGSGKSVTALSIMQLLSKQSHASGAIMWQPSEKDPIELLGLSTEKINGIRGKSIAMIFQEPMTALNPVFTCGYQVIEVLRRHEKLSLKEARQRTIELFKQVQLPDPATILNRYPHQLSGGQKQRVMIAMAMSCQPALLIADEPTTALDVTVQKKILELIRSLQQQNGMAVLLITHDLGIVADMADSIAVMYKGEIVESGAAATILKSPQHPYTKALLACRPAGKPKNERLPVVSDFMQEASLSSPIPEINTSQNIGLPTESAPTLLEVKNLCVHFPAKKNMLGKTTEFFRAVDDVSFSVQQGETVGLVGESGCGKTTLGRTILQLIKPSAGEILLAGKDISHIAAPAFRNMRKDLQIVFQDPYGSLNPRISIGNAIMEPLKIHGLLGNRNEGKEKVMDLLEKVSLSPDHFNRYPHQFSGGQRQRICIARALATHPSFLIFDESVSALDISVQAQVLNLLNDLKKSFGFTAIFISHDLSVVHYICNRILVMNKGKIVESGEASQVYYHPENAYTQRLIEAIPGKNFMQSA